MHVYQTKIGPERRTLRSKAIARELSRRFRGIYWPRQIDIQNVTGKTAEVRKRNQWNVQQREKNERTRTEIINRPRWNKNNRAGRRPKENYSAGLTQRKEKGNLHEEKSGPGQYRRNRQREWRGNNRSHRRTERRNTKPIEAENGGKKLHEISCQLQRLTNLLEGLVRGGRNL